MIATRHPEVKAAYYALRLPIGTTVDYRGSFPCSHGTYTVEPCACASCVHAVLIGEESSRYQLTRKGTRSYPHHVRYTSVAPAEEGPSGESLPVWASVMLVKNRLRETIPGIELHSGLFERSKWTIEYSGAETDEVKTVLCALLHDYKNGTAAPPAVSVPDGEGGTITGRPRLTGVEIYRSDIPF